MTKFAFTYGYLFSLLGIAGFLPALKSEHEHPDLLVTAEAGLVLGLFAVNVLHNFVHLVFGAWGIVAHRNAAAARVYARSVAAVYTVLAVMGLISIGNLHAAFGAIPLYGHDVWLHALLAIGAGYFGFAYRDRMALQAA